jgi:hypothetical protein
MSVRDWQKRILALVRGRQEDRLRDAHHFFGERKEPEKKPKSGGQSLLSLRASIKR